MIQKQIRHPRDTFPVCRYCGTEPRHIEGRGSHSREVFDVMHPTGTRHQLECHCARTPWMPELIDALAEWRRHYGLMPEPEIVRDIRSRLHLHKDHA